VRIAGGVEGHAGVGHIPGISAACQESISGREIRALCGLRLPLSGVVRMTFMQIWGYFMQGFCIRVVSLGFWRF
jgi:hypothetical protein